MKKFISLILVLVITFSFSACVSEMPVTDIELNSVRAELLSNEFATQEKYERQRYNVINRGYVDDIHENYIVVLIPNSSGATSIYVQLRYLSSELDFVRQLKKGDYVKFVGTLTELRTGGLWMYFKDVVFTEKL